VAVRPVAIESIAHVNRRRQVGIARGEQRGEVLAAVLAAGAEQRDRPVGRDRHEAGREQAGAVRIRQLAVRDELSAALAHELEDPDRRVVVVEHAARRGPTVELVVNRNDRVDVIADDLPLGRCGHRGLEVSLQPIETMERRADAIAQQGHDRGGALVVLGSLCLGRRRRSEHAAAATAAQPIELPGACDEWRLAGDAHDTLGLAEPVEPAV